MSLGDRSLKVAIVHDWLVSYGGAEKVLEEQLALFPDAHIYTLLHKPGTQSPLIESRKIRTSMLQDIPISDHRRLITLMPYTVEQFDLSEYDLVISNTFAVVHGVVTSPEQLHLAYINRTMRYAWDTYHQDLAAFGVGRGIKHLVASLGYHYLRLWDIAAFQRPDRVLANSPFSSRRIQKYYRRDAYTLFAPVDTSQFSPARKRDDYYVTVGRLVPLKGVDLMVKAFLQSGRRLIVVGDGPQMDGLRAHAGTNIKFTGKLNTREVAEILGQARGYLAMAEEDFGIANVEALASGTPVIAWGQGGVKHTIRHGENGWLFNERTSEALNVALDRFEHLDWPSAEEIAHTAQQFSASAYRAGLRQQIELATRQREL